MRDFYICSDDKEALSEFIVEFKNVIGPVSGISAYDAYTDEVGTEYEATPEIGNPDHWYACIRTDDEEIVLPADHISTCDEDGAKVVGIWA